MTSTRWPTSSVGTIDGEGIWYGLTMKAWIPSARPIASATITTSSMKAPRPVVGLGIRVGHRRRRRRLSRPPTRLRRRRRCPPQRSTSSVLCGLADPRARPPSSTSSWVDALGVDRRRLLGLGEDEIVLDPPAALGDPGALADAAAQVVELRPADVAAGDDLELLDLRRVDRERALDADAERLLANGEGLARAGALRWRSRCPRRPGSGGEFPRSPGSARGRGRRPQSAAPCAAGAARCCR